MKYIRYKIVENKVQKQVYDSELDLVLNFKVVFKGNKKECKEYLEKVKHD